MQSQILVHRQDKFQISIRFHFNQLELGTGLKWDNLFQD